jgi:hypothetical protein
MNGILRSRGSAFRRCAGGNSGLTTLEVLIAGFIGAFVLITAFVMYLTSLDTWDIAGTRLALQRNGDRAVREISFQIRRGDDVMISPDGTALDVTRTIGETTETWASFWQQGSSLVYWAVIDPDPDEGVPAYTDTVRLADNVVSLNFSKDPPSIGGEVMVTLTLEDDMGTPDLIYDDQRVEIRSLAVPRNEAY